MMCVVIIIIYTAMYACLIDGKIRVFKSGIILSKKNPIIPDMRGHKPFHAFKGPAWEYCPIPSSKKNNGIPAKIRQSIKGIKKAPKIKENTERIL